ncbi:MAG: hypothetical protein ACOYMQ_03090, partial [Pseudanabaena sp.]
IALVFYVIALAHFIPFHIANPASCDFIVVNIALSALTKTKYFFKIQHFHKPDVIFPRSGKITSGFLGSHA